MVMQALMFAAMLAFARALDGGFRFFGPLAGVLVGLQLFLRYDADSGTRDVRCRRHAGALCADIEWAGASL